MGVSNSRAAVRPASRTDDAAAIMIPFLHPQCSVKPQLRGGMVTLYWVTMKPFGAHGHATTKRDHATLLFINSRLTNYGGAALLKYIGLV